MTASEPGPLRALEQLGAALGDAIAAEERARKSAPRRFARPALIVGATLLVLAGTAIAGTTLITKGDPVSPAADGDLPPELTPQPGTAVLDSLRADDPAGGPPWGLRISTSETGNTCVAVGQVVDGELGVIRSGEFHALPLRGPGTCADLSKAPYSLGLDMTPGAAGRTLVVGVAGQRADSVEIAGPDGLRKLIPSDRGGFLAVYPGSVTNEDLQITVVFKDGKRESIDLIGRRG